MRATLTGTPWSTSIDLPHRSGGAGHAGRRPRLRAAVPGRPRRRAADLHRAHRRGRARPLDHLAAAGRARAQRPAAARRVRRLRRRGALRAARRPARPVAGDRPGRPALPRAAARPAPARPPTSASRTARRCVHVAQVDSRVPARHPRLDRAPTCPRTAARWARCSTPTAALPLPERRPRAPHRADRRRTLAALERDLAEDPPAAGTRLAVDELEVGLTAVAAPVRGRDGEVVAALGVSGTDRPARGPGRRGRSASGRAGRRTLGPAAAERTHRKEGAA